MGTERILLHPWPTSKVMDYQLLVEIIHFENESDGTASLLARWSIKAKDGVIVLPERRSSHRIPAANQGQEGLVAALNEALAGFSREIAQELTPLQGRCVCSGL